MVVNNSVVLLHFIQKKRAEFVNLTGLIIDACVTSSRPIFLVALTSIAGFTPMLFETSEQSHFLVPVTLSLAAGLNFGMIRNIDTGADLLCRTGRYEAAPYYPANT